MIVPINDPTAPPAVDDPRTEPVLDAGILPPSESSSVAQAPQLAAPTCPHRSRLSTNGSVPAHDPATPDGVSPPAGADSLTPLTAPEQVLVKDGWNKFLAYQDMLIELFFERLLHEEPELSDRFGDAIDLVPGYFAGLFDAGVRQLMPHTERTLRESYRGIYPAPPEGPKTLAGYATLLADLGMRPAHWLTACRVWTWALSHIPHLEEYDRENLSKGTLSAAYRFFTLHVLPPALVAINEYDDALTPAMIHEMRRTGDLLADDALAAGIDFYRTLFQTYPEVVPYFGRTDVDTLAMHLMQTVGFLLRALDSGQDVSHELRELARVHATISIPDDAYAKIGGPLLTVMKQRIPDFTTEQEHAWTVLLSRVSNVLKQPRLNQQRVLNQAGEFIRLIAGELAWEPIDYERRWHEVEREVWATGTYTHTGDELTYGAQVAWRNSTKCIGRIAWRNMLVRDLRHVTDPDAMFRECAEHLRLATNGGNLQIVMNVFRPKKPLERWGPRIWNSQYVRFAGYRQADGTVLGDGANVDLTEALVRLGWTPPATQTAYDCLPLAIEVPGQAPKLYTFDPADVLTVPLEHPAYPAFDALGLQWCAVPAISNFRMNIGGVQYGCIPFNGWFMETEIARNVWEEWRYDKAETVARAMNIDTSSEQTLWRDRAFLELNVAVLHSFSKAKVTLVDHQTASRQFLVHDQREKRAGRECPAQWSWVTPSAGGSSTPVWHHEMRDFFLSPSYHYAADKWMVVDTDLVIAGEHTAAEKPAVADHILILYGSETGTAESYARQTARRLNGHRPLVMTLNECDLIKLSQYQAVLVVTSTFGNGELPGNATEFLTRIRELPDGTFSQLDFSVMALGSTVYPDFCAAGATLDRELARVGGNRLVSMHQGDEIKGQADTFRQWLDILARLLGDDPTGADGSLADTAQLTVSFLASHPAVSRPNAEQPKSRLSGVEVPIVTNRELLKEVIMGSRSTRFIAFDTSGTDLSYETGDHLAIYPKNSPVLVQRLCDRLGVEADSWFTTALVDGAGAAVEGDHLYPRPTNVRQVLTEDVDLVLREPLNELIAVLLKSAGDPTERAQLAAWAQTLEYGEEDESYLTLKKHITDTFVTVVDLLDAFPSAALSFEQLIDLLPTQKPRLYSISSCSLVYPHQIHVTVGVVQITSDDGRTRPGLCSNYLADLEPGGGTTVRVAVRTSHFRPPLDPQAPMLLVGPGTGLSPLVGFLQHREVQLRAIHDAARRAVKDYPMPDDGEQPPMRVGDARLYFGCRNLNDYLYQEELESWRDAGVLTHLDVAFSRLGEETVYVQHLIGQHSRDLWEVLSQPDCHFYVCGDAKMADEVFTVLMNIARTVGGLSHAEAVSFFRTMRSQNRFVMDVWGVLLNYRTALAALQDANYSQGERWLERLTDPAGPPVATE